MTVYFDGVSRNNVSIETQHLETFQEFKKYARFDTEPSIGVRELKAQVERLKNDARVEFLRLCQEHVDEFVEKFKGQRTSLTFYLYVSID